MRILLPIFFAFCGLSAFSQTTNWIKGHAVWNYERFSPGLMGALRIETLNDTVIDGHTCQKLKCDSHTKMNTGPNGSFVHLIDTEYRFIYFEQDTVWYWKNNAFWVLYDFTASAGNVRLMEPGAESPECNDSSYLFTDQVFASNLHGTSATFYRTRDSSSNSILHGGLINSRFGMMSTDFGFSYNFFPSQQWCSQTPNEGPMYRLLCFEDDSLYYNPWNLDCDYYTYLGLDAFTQSKITVFPNPSAGKIELVSDVPLKSVKVMNVIGATLKEVNPNLASTEIDLSELPQGTYYLHIEHANNERSVKPVQISGGN